MAHARLAGRQRGVRVEVEVGAQDLGEVLVDDDGAVHLAQLEQSVGSERDAQRETVVARCQHVLGIAHADERADVAGDDHVERRANGLPGRREPNGLLHALLSIRFIQNTTPVPYVHSCHSRIYAALKAMSGHLFIEKDPQ